MSRLLRTEQPHQLQAFERYFALGEKRTHAAVAREMDVGLAIVKLWARSFSWRDRVHGRELELARQIADKSLKAAVDNKTKRRKILELALAKLARAIAEDKVKYQASDLERIYRLLEELERVDGSAAPPLEDPQAIVEYLRSILTTYLEEAYCIIREDVRRDYPKAADDLIPEPSDVIWRDSKCSTLGVLGAALIERGH
jgi:Asp-tRNA(Asn)/Glu-tRNA(Gln) amidotransferase C subunit